ncbi:DNA-binding response regulator [Kovacikia minuta CCNUW1]|uniref:DNA-binding response regulator n=1 Tax=Kovacikia minuta TaxID=2931930 RepID=UPI001CCD9B3B|nr:DNA-binding response regulator [Kovacikia minuta]UBF25218.1 DNA-binding response regulator [Kovacikia minuta CCNUW1]
MTPEQQQEVLRLRDLKLSPKQIAQKLGLRPAEVTAIVKRHAEEETVARVARGEMAPLEHCLINAHAAQRFFDPKGKGVFGKQPDEQDGVGGMAQIFVTRVERNQYLVGSYLVDYWCLGVKDCFGPRKLDRTKYESMVRLAYENFDQDYQEITLEQAQSLIFGAADYAASLGFQPHRDFEQARTHLGRPPEKLLDLKFGRRGRPYYISGPYDQPNRIIATLREHVGEGNFDVVIAGSDLSF